MPEASSAGKCSTTSAPSNRDDESVSTLAGLLCILGTSTGPMMYLSKNDENWLNSSSTLEPCVITEQILP